MDDLRSGSYADSTDISKTFDQDETFNKAPHVCPNMVARTTTLLPIGSKCPRCGQLVEVKRG
jgi:hypothetical protein